jgi:hypothetical protein
MTRRELPATLLERSAVVYVRQSTGAQVQEHRESQRQQYVLVDLARAYGFRDVRVIDEDLGRSASGATERPGFRSLVGQICEGRVGAVFSLEASRLARNGRDWHHLLELCGLVGACVIDPDGVYDPGLPNDRLLLGLKGTMSEFELTLLRKRLLGIGISRALARVPDANLHLVLAPPGSRRLSRDAPLAWGGPRVRGASPRSRFLGGEAGVEGPRRAGRTAGSKTLCRRP